MSTMKFGEILVTNYKISPKTINDALNVQKDKYFKQKMIGEILLENNTISLEIFNNTLKKQLYKKDIGFILNKYFNIEKSLITEALNKQKKVYNNSKPLGEILVDDGLISKDTSYNALAIQYGIEYINYTQIKERIDFKLYKDKKIYSAIDNSSYITLLHNIMESKALPIYWDTIDDIEVLYIGITNPNNMKSKILIETLKNGLKLKNIKIEIVMTSEKLYDDFELKYKELSKKELEDFASRIEVISANTFLQYLLIYSILQDISDIHISPAANRTARIAIRKFGVVETLLYLSYENYNKLLSVIKNNADITSNSNHIPHDGRIDGEKLLKNVTISVDRIESQKNLYNIDENILNYNFENVSFRISTYPTEAPYQIEMSDSFEKCVIRVLNLSAGLVELSELGLSKQTVNELSFAKNRSQGIIFIVGPTGSGKSTTLYSLLSSINAIEKNIITFEDPVEMRQLYWAQGQRKIVKDNIENTFDYEEAKKSILRQDPDIILMGEVRDSESANFAIEAANTGHLVFTTLHANSSAAAYERIKKLGINNLEMSSAIISIMSQRLIKKTCPHCSIKRPINNKEINTFKRLEHENYPEIVYDTNINGCKYCNYKGYVGRTTIAEIIPNTMEIKELIVNNAPEYVIRQKATEKGYKTLLEDGIEKMNNGEISITEILRVI